MPKNLSPEQQKALEERQAEQDALKISYRKLAKNPAFLDLLQKAKQFSDIASESAIYGVSYDAQGNEHPLSADKTARLLGEAAGLNKLISYAERQLAAPKPKPSQDS